MIFWGVLLKVTGSRLINNLLSSLSPQSKNSVTPYLHLWHSPALTDSYVLQITTAGWEPRALSCSGNLVSLESLDLTEFTWAVGNRFCDVGSPGQQPLSFRPVLPRLTDQSSPVLSL